MSEGRRVATGERWRVEILVDVPYQSMGYMIKAQRKNALNI